MTTTIPEWTFADRMRKAREAAGIGTTEMAERLEVSRNSITSWERGKHRPRPRDIKAWALATGVDRHWLLGDEWAPRGSNPQPTDYKSAGWTRWFKRGVIMCTAA